MSTGAVSLDMLSHSVAEGIAGLCLFDQCSLLLRAGGWPGNLLRSLPAWIFLPSYEVLWGVKSLCGQTTVSWVEESKILPMAEKKHYLNRPL